ncbi:hypothetical protein WJX81_006101 [Elliptochloris bilobata]|uniref:Polymerase nucleotidyl transferase domain-containing protein n=1 Tax=Elliptochloris bilobata TaxID=381761 RepID=A0AAW1S8P8_9CHLO
MNGHVTPAAGSPDAGPVKKRSRWEAAAALDKEVLEFARAVAPDRSEAAIREAAFQRVASACRAAYLPNVQTFGSRACGLELWSSDIDIAILGVLEPAAPSGGFTEGQKRDVCWYLEALVRELHERRSVQKTLLIRRARIPIIKVTTVEGVDVDVSINGAGGMHAAALLGRHMAAFPALRPLALTLKAMLRVAQPAPLHEVATGGLGAYSLVNMLVAHLMLDAKEGGAPGDWGRLLLGFLERFGRRFDYDVQAVAVGRGGIVPKAAVPMASARDSTRLCVEDPLTGRDISGGTTRILAVRDAFAAAASVLRLALQRSDGAPGAPALALLSQAFDVRAALSPRSPLLAELGAARPDQGAAVAR